MTDHWFKPKAYGYGASPANWKGWVATLAYCAIVFLIAYVLMVAPSRTGTGPSAMQVGLFLALLIAVSGMFIRICRAKTDGEWRWRWGKD